jgi:hypothetical protein
MPWRGLEPAAPDHEHNLHPPITAGWRMSPELTRLTLERVARPQGASVSKWEDRMRFGSDHAGHPRACQATNSREVTRK